MDPIMASVRLHRAAVRIQSRFRGKRTRDRRLQLLLNEVLDTERVYVADLTKTIEHYFKPLRELALGPARHRLVDVDTVAVIFGNLEDILVIAEELLARIAQVIDAGGSNLGEIFISHSFALKLYARYVSNFEQSNERLCVAQKNEKFVAWLRERRIALEASGCVCCPFTRCTLSTARLFSQLACVARRLGSGICNLPGLLIKPVQRIPRYELMMKELVRTKAKLGQDDPVLAEAVESLIEVSRHNEDVIFHAKNRECLYALQKKLGNAKIIGDGDRVLLRDGPVMKICRKAHKPYRLVLLSDQLLTITETGSTYKLHHRIMLADPATSASIQSVARLGDTALRIESSTKSFICYCDTVPETKRWADELQRAIDESRHGQDQAGESQDTLAPLTASRPQNISMARPVWVQDTDITACMLCRNNFTARTPLSSILLSEFHHREILKANKKLKACAVGAGEKASTSLSNLWVTGVQRMQSAPRRPGRVEPCWRGGQCSQCKSRTCVQDLQAK